MDKEDTPLSIVHVGGVSAEGLWTALDDADAATAATQLVFTLSYTDGVHAETLVERYGIPQATS